LFPTFVVYTAPAIIFLFLRIFFRRIFEKISWKFLISFFILFRITDNLTTVLALKKFNHDYSMEANRIARWLLLNINLPDIFVLFLSEIIVSIFFVSIGWFIYRKYKIWRAEIKIVVFSLAIGSFIVSLSNLLLYLYC